eukprot:TRINITY_DN6166_c0_g2_i1.p1 TRINITY_DN6166_c0_g2~~TRINITY_DN6166_c0_g2_i1.p1  ORF type:complete len:262 (-),score=15.70 TRINITY_DN6166_c0_g2_i1:74-859(-)
MRLEEIGKGRVGSVRVCVHRVSGERFACKSIQKERLQCAEEVEDVRREVAVMDALRGCEQAVQLRATYEDEDYVHLVMDLCEGGELWERLKARQRYSEEEASEVLRVLVSLLRRCHECGVMHRDVKPENLLLRAADNDVDVCVIDFGVAVFFQPGETFSEIVGSPFYVAPEVLHECYGPPSDIWSAGVLLYVLLSGTPPFWGESDEAVFRAILELEPDFAAEPWMDVSDEAKDLILRMLTKDPVLRISPDEILDHPWMQPS